MRRALMAAGAAVAIAACAAVATRRGPRVLHADRTRPYAPTRLRVHVIDRRATAMNLTWIAPATADGHRVYNYKVYVARGSLCTTPHDGGSVACDASAAVCTCSPGILPGHTITEADIADGSIVCVGDYRDMRAHEGQWRFDCGVSAR